MRVLIVEDEAPMARLLELGLARQGIATDTATDGARALELVRIYDYDVMVLDRDLPLVHGDEVCRRVLEMDLGVRVLMLTAASSLDDKVTGFGLGADDYLAKPFDLPELVARLRALDRRGPMAHPHVLTHGDLTLDVHRQQVTRGGAEIRLTPKEIAVLELLLRADGGAVSSAFLQDKAWNGDGGHSGNAVRLVVHTLRRKLGAPKIVQTVTGTGYRLGTQ
ncbi:response regulator transcription factor [Streptomyces sp. NPDC001941]|uniref:response regulator transcription factor n=1 Tax=Streptomyces sp. NPDC001941 TaxID=3154659 RepID=UPI003331C84C